VAKILSPIEGLVRVQTGEDDRGRPTISFGRDEAAIAEAGRADGIYALLTNLPGRLSATTVLRLYKDQW
jgi:hypothetical protein